MLTLIGQWKHEELAINLVNSIYRVERVVSARPGPLIAKLHMASPGKRERGNAGDVEVYRSRRDLLDEATRILG